MDGHRPGDAHPDGGGDGNGEKTRVEENRRPGRSEQGLERLRELGEAWIKDERRWINDRHWPKKLTETQDLLDHPEIMDVALNEDILRAAAAYYGQVPRLYRVAVWWSPPNDTLQGSQLFHYDGLDNRQAKVFINLKEVTPESGPLYFLDAAQSDEFDAKVGYSKARIADEDVFSIFKPGDLHSAAGPAGEAFILDTGRCLHYGSRKNSEGRLIFMINYSRVNCVEPGKGDPVLDPVREELVRERVEELAEHAHEAALAREPAVERVRQRADDVDDRGRRRHRSVFRANRALGCSRGGRAFGQDRLPPSRAAQDRNRLAAAAVLPKAWASALPHAQIGEDR